MSEAALWIATGKTLSGESLHNELWNLSRTKTSDSASGPSEGDPAKHPIDAAARDLLAAHDEGRLCLRGQDGKKATTILPRPIRSADITFNAFTNCLISPAADTTFWRNIRVEANELRSVFAARAEAARSRIDAAPGAEGQCRRWLVSLMEHRQPKLKSKSDLRREARAKFDIGVLAFDRVWRQSIALTNSNWGRPGTKVQTRATRIRLRTPRI